MADARSKAALARWTEARGVSPEGKRPRHAADIEEGPLDLVAPLPSLPLSLDRGLPWTRLMDHLRLRLTFEDKIEPDEHERLIVFTIVNYRLKEMLWENEFTSSVESLCTGWYASLLILDIHALMLFRADKTLGVTVVQRVSGDVVKLVERRGAHRMCLVVFVTRSRVGTRHRMAEDMHSLTPFLHCVGSNDTYQDLSRQLRATGIGFSGMVIMNPQTPTLQIDSGSTEVVTDVFNKRDAVIGLVVDDAYSEDSPRREKYVVRLSIYLSSLMSFC